MTHHDNPDEHPDEQTPGGDHGATTSSTGPGGADPDADPGSLNPRDTRGEDDGDESERVDPDGDPGQLNPRDTRG